MLDVGCGTGLLAEHIVELVGPTGFVLGVDPLPLRIELAKKKARANLALEVADAYALDHLASAGFDVIVLNAVFHWLPEKIGPLKSAVALTPVLQKSARPRRRRQWRQRRDRPHTAPPRRAPPARPPP